MTNTKTLYSLSALVLCLALLWGLTPSVVYAQSQDSSSESDNLDRGDLDQPSVPSVPEPVPEPNWKGQPRSFRRNWRKRRQPVRPVRKVGAKPQTGLNLMLVDSKLWGDVTRNYWLMHFSGLGVDVDLRRGSNRQHLGVSVEVFRFDIEYWGELFNDADSYRLTTGEFLKASIEIGIHGFFLRSGWKVLRSVNWGMPERVIRRSVVERLSLDSIRNVSVEADMQFFLPEFALGWSSKRFRLEAWIGLLTWDLKSYVAGGRAAFNIPELAVILETKYQQEAMSLYWRQGESQELPLPASTWTRSFWEASLLLSFDIAVAFRKKNKSISGPVQLIFGIRYRHILENQVGDSTSTYFTMEPSGHFALFGGLRLSFGTQNIKTSFRKKR